MEIQASHPDTAVHFQSSGDVHGNWDADRLAQVVTNLVVNAIEHGGNAPVTLVACESGDCVKLTVHNDGPPIPPDVQQKMFEPLARGSSDDTDNVGLGLFIARAIVANVIRVTAERDGLIFYTCDSCGTQGAYSVPSPNGESPNIERLAYAEGALGPTHKTDKRSVENQTAALLP